MRTEHGKALSETATLLSIWAVTKQAPMNMSQKLLGKWTIDKRTSGESKGTSGSYSENYDVLGRELMLEYELRLLPDDECIIFVRGENPIRDKKWFPWEHEAYLEARKCGAFVPGGAERKTETTDGRM